MVAARYGLQYMLENNVEAEVKRKEEIVRTYFNDNLQGDAVQIRGIGLILLMERRHLRSLTDALRRDLSLNAQVAIMM